MNDNLKHAINLLQNYIVPEYKSDNVLLIFDNQAELLKYKRKHKYLCPNVILTYIDEISYTNKLDGLCYKRYHFVFYEECYDNE